eukprot:5871815-Alexandrium_andersonii.AAC.1
MDRGWASASRCCSTPTMSYATTRSRGWSRSSDSVHPPERERLRMQAFRPGYRPAPVAHAPPGSTERDHWRYPRCD